MPDIFINLKRFDVSKKYGGLCPVDNPIQWIEGVIDESIQYEVGSIPGIQIVYLLPEGLVSAAANRLASYPNEKTKAIAIGCQGVHWEDVRPGGNFGAFTTSLPASAAKSLGCSWAIIGHSEERKAKLQIIASFDPAVNQDAAVQTRASQAINDLINAEVISALKVGLNVLLCMGETAQERGEGAFSEQQPRIKSVLKSQLTRNLRDVDSFPDQKIVIGYEPIWAIGPGKTPPGGEYISFVSSFIKRTINDEFGFNPRVVYGGGLKKRECGDDCRRRYPGRGINCIDALYGRDRI